MLSSLFRPRRGRQRIDRSSFGSPFTSPALNRNGEAEGEGEGDELQRREGAYDDEDEDEELYSARDEDEDGPSLPLFSASHLDKLPLYNITHAIRMLIVQKCETTLTWDQMRLPQVSQFLVKPVQSQIRANHFNRATITALLANCLQFKKEVESTPGNASVSRTRAMFSELLAMRLLKEYTTRELIDALSYNFNPLQGLSPNDTGAHTPGMPGSSTQLQQVRGARISTVEIAIRATAKKFLSHPLVVQQLEAIWAGNILFHTAADHLHRNKEPPTRRKKRRGYGTLEGISPGAQPTDDYISSTKSVRAKNDDTIIMRRSVTLYDPRDASLFKLSRLRVPRYRQIFSTVSYTAMLGLFLAVLAERSTPVTPLEIVFWIWSAGYMLDEVVGFSEQGFGLYIMSVWNAFDLGILLLFIVYYILRVCCMLIPDPKSQRWVAHMAYDVLASTAILLFPRAFSVLDHYKYFSQLLIAFRMMAQDLVAILILMVISCSGFFVAFTLAFSSEDTYGTNVAFALFQIVLGFTPAAWNVWGDYNILGQIIMSMFLIICHFLIVTILITVLTNSFMAIVQNANEEHQFLFAVNTISMVKSDALFSYIAPTNVLAWIVSPLRYMIPFRQFVKFNRTIIKVTHFPVLFLIFTWERLVLSRQAYEPTDLIDGKATAPSKHLPFNLNKNLFSPGAGRLREASVVSHHKDRVLEEVFRRPFRGSTMRTTAPEMETEPRRQSADVVDTWMTNVGREGGASPPMEQPRSVVDRLETRRPLYRRAITSADRLKTRRDYSSASRSVVSEPEDRAFSFVSRPKRIEEETDQDLSMESIPHDTEADGDDELVTGDEGDNATVGKSSHAFGTTPDDGEDKENIPTSNSEPNDYFATPTASRPNPIAGPSSLSQVARARLLDSPSQDPAPRALPARIIHNRNASSKTILFQPPTDTEPSSASEYPGMRRSSRPQTSGRQSGNLTPIQQVQPQPQPQQQPSGRRTPRPSIAASRPNRPPMPIRSVQQTAPDLRLLNGFTFEHGRPGQTRRQVRREPSFNALALDLASDFGENRYGAAIDVGGISGMPASFSEQLFRERELARRAEVERKRTEDEDKGLVGRIMLARMNTLEEGFREMLNEVRVMRMEGGSGSRSGNGTDAGGGAERSGGAGLGNGAGGPLMRSQRGSALSISTVPLASGGGDGGNNTATASSGLGIAQPLTPGLVRPGSAGSRARKSPRKLQRRGTKGKEPTSPETPLALTPELPQLEEEEDAMGSVRRRVVNSPMESKRASVIFVGSEVESGIERERLREKERERDREKEREKTTKGESEDEGGRRGSV